MTMIASTIRGVSGAGQLAALIFAISVGTLATALIFEHVGGYKPCALCLQQRYAYYFAIPASLAGLFLLRSQGFSTVVAMLFAAIALGYLLNAGLGAYHSGVEWGWWSGPTSCTGGVDGVTTNAGGLLSRIEQAGVVRCDKAEWRLLGLSFAGWNTLISLLLASISIRAVLQSR